MLTDSLQPQSNTESSTEECPTKFTTRSCDQVEDGKEGQDASRPQDTAPSLVVSLTGALAPGLVAGTAVHFRLDTSTGLLKLKSYHKNGHPSCPLCWRHRSKFYCQECICAGDFVHSKDTLYARYTNHKLTLTQLNRQTQQTKQQISEKVMESVKKRKLREDIKQLKNKMKHMKYVIKAKQDRKVLINQNLAKLTNSNKKRQDRLPEYVRKVDQIRVCVERFVQDIKAKRTHVYSYKCQLNQMKAGLVSSLQDIFPIEEVYPVSPDKSDVMLDFLAEAMATSYVHGRWVSVEQSGEMQYKVVAPLLACSGDYSPIYALIATSKEGIAAAQPALNISAGLSLLAQYIGLISTLTSVPMPLKLKYQDFGIIETSEFKYSVKIAKLNLWVVALCLALGVDPREIRPVQTVHNVLLLVEHIKRTKLSSDVDWLTSTLTQSELEESFSEFGYFEAVPPVVSVSVWEQVIHRENEELRHLEEDAGQEPGAAAWHDDHRDWDNEAEADNFNEWESVGADDVYSSSPSDMMTSPPASSSLSFVSSTVSSLLWGITSPKSPRK